MSESVPLSHTNTILDVSNEVRKALHLYDGQTKHNSAESSSVVNTDSQTEECVKETNELTDTAEITDLMNIYNELSIHRKSMTQLMAKVKRCMLRSEKRCKALQQNQNNYSGNDDTTSKSNEKRGRKKGCATGLTKPIPVTDSLCAFVGVPPGTQLARAEVTKFLHRYIKEQGLKDTNNGQYVLPDSTLKNLLNWDEHNEDKLHIFAMQKRMNIHFLYTSKNIPTNVKQEWNM